MMRSGLVEETGVTDDERRRYYRITKFGGQVLSAEVTRLGKMMGAVRRKGLMEGARP
jgi:hypothetical protein